MKIKSALAAALIAFSLFAFYACSEKETANDKYVLSVEYYEDGILNVALTVDGGAKNDGATEIPFNLYPAAYREGAAITPLKEGDEAGEFLVREVTFNGRSAKFRFDGKDENVLSVMTDGALKKGERFSVGIKYSCVLSKSDERLALTESTVNLGNFFPMLCVYDGDEYIVCEYGKTGDPFVSECADFSVSLVVPSEYAVASGIKAKSLDSGENRSEYRYEIKNVRDVAFTLCKDYSIKQQKWGDKTVNYYFYSDENSDATLSVAVDALGYFSEKFGEYPYDTFALAETAFDAGGMEYPCFAMIADDLGYSDYIFAVVHEIAHQWWYGLVGNDQVKEAYLDESLAEYSTYAYFADNPCEYVDAQRFYEETKSGCAIAERAFTSLYDDYLPRIDRRLDEFINAYDYYDCVYAKGFLALKAAEDSIGRRKLASLMKKYCEKNRYGIADTEKFLFSTGAARPILESYLSGKAIVR